MLFVAGSLNALAGDQNTLLIAPGDLLHIQVADTPDMDEDARVTDRGMVPIVGIGDVKVAGLTPGDAAAVVHDKLIDGHYLNHPQVSIIVKEFATQQVSVIGEVKTSGSYPIATPRPILAVLALAGGLNPEADRHILIERQGDQEHPLDYYVSNDGTLAIKQQVMVNPGDTVVVSRAGIVYILGDVNRPGGYVMSNNESQLTLLQGLALAGGVTRAAKTGPCASYPKETGGWFYRHGTLGWRYSERKTARFSTVARRRALPAIFIRTQLRDNWGYQHCRFNCRGGDLRDSVASSASEAQHAPRKLTNCISGLHSPVERLLLSKSVARASTNVLYATATLLDGRFRCACLSSYLANSLTGLPRKHRLE